MSGGMLDQPAPVPPPLVAPRVPQVGSGSRAPFLVWMGAILALGGSILAVVVVAIEWTLSRNVVSGTPEATVIEALGFTYIASYAVVGAGIFLAALGLAHREPQRNAWFLLGGTLVLIGSVGSAAVNLYIRSLFSSGQFPGIETISTLSLLGSLISPLYPLGLGIFFFGFVVPRRPGWNG